MIPYGRQHVDDDDVAAVVEVLRGDWLTQGPAVEQFERSVAETVEAAHAVAFANGTAALHAAMWAAGIGPGDLVATSPLSFVASANCARYVGAGVAFVDVDPATLNLDISAVPPSADALVAVHYAGLPVDLSALTRRPRVVIEDAAHALGARTPDGPVGNCARSDLTMFSFHPVKTVTTGEGGVITTNDAELDRRLRLFRNHGIERAPEQGGWYYEVRDLGHNFRLTDIQAALGTSQLNKLDAFVAQRGRLAERYRQLLSDLPVVLPPAAPTGSSHAYHLFAVRVPERRRVYDELHAAGVKVQVHYVPIYRHPLYAADGHDPHDFPETELAYEGLLSLPMFPTLTLEQQDEVVAALSKAVKR